MIYILTLILIGVVSAGIGHLHGRWHEKRTKVVELVKLDNNSEEATRQIGKATKQRAWVCRLDVCLSDPIMNANGEEERTYLHAMETMNLWMYDGKNPNIRGFFRLCHLLGMEVYLQQEGTPSPAGTYQEEMTTYIRPEHINKKINFSYPYNKKT